MAWNQPGEDKTRPPARGAPDKSPLEMLRRWQQRVQRLWRPGSGGGTAAAFLLLLVAAVWLASGYFQIGASERGVVQRFGRYVVIEQPGHGWHWPWPIETMTRLNISNIPSLDSKALMLTADQSLIDLSWSVQYRISDPLHYLFQVRDPEPTLREVSETEMRALVGSMPLQALLNGDARARITSEARARIQGALNSYGAGVTLTGINLTDEHLPDPVLSAQRDADKAADDRQRALTEAQAYASDILAKAQSTTQRQLADAQIYAAQTVASADVEAERFTQVVDAYAQAPEITRNRLYIDTMEGILSRSRKIVVDVKSGTGNLIYLPLDKLAEEMRAVPGAPSNNAGGAAAGSAAAGSAAVGSATAPAGAAAGSANGAAADQDDRGRERTER